VGLPEKINNKGVIKMIRITSKCNNCGKVEVRTIARISHARAITACQCGKIMEFDFSIKQEKLHKGKNSR